MTSPNPDQDAPAADPSPAYRRALGGLSLSLLASWLLLLAPLPYGLLAGLAALAAGVFLVRLAISGWRTGRRSTALIALLLGLPAVAMMLLSTITSIAFYGPMLELQECRASAITQQARALCTQQSQESVAAWIGRLFGG